MILYRLKSILFFSALWTLVVLQLIWPSRGRSNDDLRETAVVRAVIKYRQKSSLVIVLQRGRYLYNLSVKP